VKNDFLTKFDQKNDGWIMDGWTDPEQWMDEKREREKDKILERPQAIGHPSLLLIHHYN